MNPQIVAFGCVLAMNLLVLVLIHIERRAAYKRDEALHEMAMTLYARMYVSGELTSKERSQLHAAAMNLNATFRSND